MSVLTPIKESPNMSNTFDDKLSSGSLPINLSPSNKNANCTGVLKSPLGVKSPPEAIVTKIPVSPLSNSLAVFSDSLILRLGNRERLGTPS